MGRLSVVSAGPRNLGRTGRCNDEICANKPNGRIRARYYMIIAYRRITPVLERQNHRRQGFLLFLRNGPKTHYKILLRKKLRVYARRGDRFRRGRETASEQPGGRICETDPPEVGPTR